MVLNIGDVIYNALYPLAAPDIIFGPEDESFRPYYAAGEEGDLKSPKNSMSDWNCKDPTRLLSLILELRLYALFAIIHFSFLLILLDLLSETFWLRILYLLLFRELYMTYQRKRVGEVEDERLKFELSTIVSREVLFSHR